VSQPSAKTTGTHLKDKKNDLSSVERPAWKILLPRGCKSSAIVYVNPIENKSAGQLPDRLSHDAHHG
jgi:hypothetical protein